MTNETDEKQTTITLSVKTRNDLAALGKKNQTYDELIQQLIGHYKKVVFP